MEMYEVGGCVRDEIMGRKSKDIDFSVVLDAGDRVVMKGYSYDDPFRYMSDQLRVEGFKVFVENPEFLTVRAMFPKGHVNERLVADFVLARKESGYADGRRPDAVEPGTLLDDLARRDFTMNAVAKAADGSLVDPYDGRRAIEQRMIRAVGKAEDRFTEDSLRILRAIRFSVTLGFYMDADVRGGVAVCYRGLRNVSKERINDELSKMFAHSTTKSIEVLFRDMRPVGEFLINDLGIRLMPTMKEK